MPIEMDRLYVIAYKALDARQSEFEALSDNMANINTPGFKTRRTSFAAALAYEQENRLRRGVEIGASAPQFIQGIVQSTGQPFDMAIDGDGLFVLRQPDGTTGYSRVGNFHPDANGRLVNEQGAVVAPGITIPQDAQDMHVDGTGVVTAMRPTGPVTLGRLQIARFANPEGLLDVGNGVYQPSVSSGAAVLVNPGENGAGQVVGSALEMSNVDASREIVNMLQVQRSYGLSLKALQISDQMSAITNQLSR
jgi:flagellar basal-body rod protein FlgG